MWLLPLLALPGCRLLDQRTFERAPTGPTSAALARPELPKLPLLTITFTDPAADWRPAVHEAVRGAMAHQPDVRFQVVTDVPTSADRAIQATFVKVGQSDGAAVAREIAAAGAAPDHVAVGLRGDAGNPPREARIYTQ